MTLGILQVAAVLERAGVRRRGAGPVRRRELRGRRARPSRDEQRPLLRNHGDHTADARGREDRATVIRAGAARGADHSRRARTSRWSTPRLGERSRSAGSWAGDDGAPVSWKSSSTSSWPATANAPSSRRLKANPPRSSMATIPGRRRSFFEPGRSPSCRSRRATSWTSDSYHVRDRRRPRPVDHRAARLPVRLRILRRPDEPVAAADSHAHVRERRSARWCTCTRPTA